MKKASIGIVALIIFSAIMLVIIWFIFTAGVGFFMEFAVPSENAATFAAFSRKIGEGWSKGSVQQDFRLKSVSARDSFAIGILTSDSAQFIYDLNVCLHKDEKFCVKAASKDRIEKCRSYPEMCVCLFRIKTSYGYCQTGGFNTIYTAAYVSNHASEITAINKWNDDHLVPLFDTMDRIDIIECSSLMGDLRCSYNNKPCTIHSDGLVLTWIQADSQYTTISMDRAFVGDTPSYNLVLKTYPPPKYFSFLDAVYTGC